MIAVIQPNMNTKKSNQQQYNPSSSYQYIATPTAINNVKRIRTPHANDVLCGRGGGINSHPGNKNFRNWVRERKEAYNLATSKVAKAGVAREIVQIVRCLSPAGRFLMREGGNTSSSSYWVEIDDNKAMAKTSQALREGAPAIRSKAKLMIHHDEEEEHIEQEIHQEIQPSYDIQSSYDIQPSNDIQPTRRSSRNRKNKRLKLASAKNLLKNANEAITELQSSNMEHNEEDNVDEVEEYHSPDVIETPSLIPISLEPPNSNHFTTFLEEQNQSFSRKRPLPRAHSLAFSDNEDFLVEESDTFHDPFARDDEDINNDPYFSSAIEGNPELSAARSRLARQHSTSISSLHLPRSTSVGNNGDNRFVVNHYDAGEMSHFV